MFTRFRSAASTTTMIVLGLLIAAAVALFATGMMSGNHPIQEPSSWTATPSHEPTAPAVAATQGAKPASPSISYLCVDGHTYLLRGTDGIAADVSADALCAVHPKAKA